MHIKRVSYSPAMKLLRKGWSKEEVQKIAIPKKLSNVTFVDNNTVLFDDIDRGLVKSNIWTAVTDFYDSQGASKFKRVVVEREGDRVKKSTYNAFIDYAKPWDNIDTEYKAIIASKPKSVKYLA